jgi:hypothetical protein
MHIQFLSEEIKLLENQGVDGICFFFNLYLAFVLVSLNFY